MRLLMLLLLVLWLLLQLLILLLLLLLRAATFAGSLLPLLLLLVLRLLLLLLIQNMVAVFPDCLRAVRGIPYARFLFVCVCGVVRPGAAKRCKFRRSIVHTPAQENPRFIPPPISIGLKSSGDIPPQSI